MKIPALCLLIVFALMSVSCTTLSNRRDLYSIRNDDGEYTQKLKKMDLHRYTRLGHPGSH